MPDLLLIRHAKSDYPAGISDHDRPLSARGRLDAAVAANWLAQSAIVTAPAIALVSSARRTRDTWAILQTGLEQSAQLSLTVNITSDLYEAGVGAVEALVARHRDDGQTVIVVGHNPTMHATALHLAGDSVAQTVLAERFPTCTIAVVRMGADSISGALVDLQVPRAKVT